jgi:2,5-diamino-6-(ribosylamino)-4(3H)-pyrimidinone 5'-phosphate reductase
MRKHQAERVIAKPRRTVRRVDDPHEGTTRNRPYVVLHVAVSVDGSTAGFEADVGRFYELATTWHEDVSLTGADTILAQESALAEADLPGPSSDGSLLAVVDGRGRVRAWQALRDAGYWSDVVAVHSATTPPRHHGYPEIVAGRDRVDLGSVLVTLREQYDAEVVRVDSGGALNGALLDAGLVDEVSLLVHPALVGAAERRPWHGGGPAAGGPMTLMAAQTLPDGLVWLRHRIGAVSLG